MSSMSRIFFIHDEIMRFGHVRTSKIIAEFERSQRQVQRDIKEMKEMGAPIEYSVESNGYIYLKPWNIFDYADKKTLLFYLFASKMAENLSLVPVISKKLLSDIEDVYLKSYSQIAGRISYEFSEMEPFKPEIISEIIESMQTKTALDIEYLNAAGNRSKRTVEPWHLLNYSGKWYILAWCRKSLELRTFHISRIVKILGEFALAEPFSKEIDEELLKTYLDQGYGIFKNDKTVDVTIRFHEPILNYIEKITWHPRQRTTETSVNGKKCLEVTIPANDFTEILAKTLSLTPHAEAVSPKEFRDIWKQRLSKAVKKFDIPKT